MLRLGKLFALAALLIAETVGTSWAINPQPLPPASPFSLNQRFNSKNDINPQPILPGKGKILINTRRSPS